MTAIRDRSRFGLFLIVLGLTLALVNLGFVSSAVSLFPVLIGPGSLVSAFLWTYLALALTLGFALTGFIGILFVEIGRGRSAGPGEGMLDPARGALLIAATAGLSYFLFGLVLGFVFLLPGPEWRYVHLGLFYLGSLAIGVYLSMVAKRFGSDLIARVGTIAFALGVLSILLIVLVIGRASDGASSLWMAVGSSVLGLASLALWIVVFARIFRAFPKWRPRPVGPSVADTSSSDLTTHGGP